MTHTSIPESTEVVVVGAGQSGIAMSEHLRALHIDHIILERDRVAEQWRTRRWDSLHANGPAWHDRFPNLTFSGDDPDGFVPKDRVAQYFQDYAAMIDAPVFTGMEVISVTKKNAGKGFVVIVRDLCDRAEYKVTATYVVAATGPFQTPSVPALVTDCEAAEAGLTQMHSVNYRNPAQLEAGGVLVVGSGSSGLQIAVELNAAGRSVTLAVGDHERPPRRYRGRDNVWWLGVLGRWDMLTPDIGAEHKALAVTGADGGYSIDFRNLAADGITLVGRAEAYDSATGKMTFRDDLIDTIHAGDATYLGTLDAADYYIEANGLDFPEEPEARVLPPDPECMVHPLTQINLAAAGITTIIWATGFGVNYDWLEVDGVLDRSGHPLHKRGVAPVNGIYFLGLPWLSRRGSSFIWGCWHDAKYLADQIQIQRGYSAYTPATVTASALSGQEN